jgi:hypothetical protein
VPHGSGATTHVDSEQRLATSLQVTATDAVEP